MHRLPVVALILLLAPLLVSDRAQAGPFGSNALAAVEATSIAENAACVRRRVCGPRGCAWRTVCGRRW